MGVHKRGQQNKHQHRKLELPTENLNPPPAAKRTLYGSVKDQPYLEDLRLQGLLLLVGQAKSCSKITGNW